MADFTGFTFNGVHSKELGLTRVSGGNRYERNLFPQFKAQTVEIPGADGTYFFGGQYTQRQFTINVAFDNLKEAQLRRMQQLFSMKQDGKLIFDEYPYKEYSVYVAQSPNFKEICFGTDGTGMEYGERVYKGEATIQFVAYQPYAESVFTEIQIEGSPNFTSGTTEEEGPHQLFIIIDEDNDQNGFSYHNSGKTPEGVKSYEATRWPNLQGWLPASGILNKKIVYSYDESSDEVIEIDTYNSETKQINLYNPGDKGIPFILTLSSAPTSIKLYKYEDRNDELKAIEELHFDGTPIGQNSEDEILVINTKTHLIEVQRLDKNSQDQQTYYFNRYYNEHIISGDFFTIPQTEIAINDGKKFTINPNSLYVLEINSEEDTNPNLYYKYLYL